MSPQNEDWLALNRAVADWRAKLHGDDTGAVRRAYDAWLAGSPARRQADTAYRAVEAESGLTSLAVPPLHAPKKAWRSASGAWAALAATMLVAGALGVLLHEKVIAPPLGQEYAAAQTVRAYSLEGGVDMILDRNGLVRRQPEGVRPAYLMLTGRARFRTGSQSEPFTVSLETLSVHASRATFDIARTGQNVRIVSLAGAIDIEPQDQTRTAIHLTPGKAFVRDAQGERVEMADKSDVQWTTAMLPLDGLTLGDVIAIGNKAGGTSIVLGDPTLAGMPLQGQLAAVDTDALAQQLAAAFDLDLSRDPRGFVLTRKK